MRGRTRNGLRKNGGRCGDEAFKNAALVLGGRVDGWVSAGADARCGVGSRYRERAGWQRDGADRGAERGLGHGGEGRREAIAEIVRVLKPGGQAALMDFKHVGQYAEDLRRSGIADARASGPSFWIFPPVRVARGRKT